MTTPLLGRNRRRNDLPLRTRLSAVLTGDPRPIILWTAVSFATMGIWLLNPFFNTFGTVASYRLLAQIADETIWGIWLFGLSVALFWTVVDYRKRSLRLAVLFVSALTWFFIAAAMGISNIAAFGVGILISNGLMIAWAFARSWLDV